MARQIMEANRPNCCNSVFSNLPQFRWTAFQFFPLPQCSCSACSPEQQFRVPPITVVKITCSREAKMQCPIPCRRTGCAFSSAAAPSNRAPRDHGIKIAAGNTAAPWNPPVVSLVITIHHPAFRARRPSPRTAKIQTNCLLPEFSAMGKFSTQNCTKPASLDRVPISASSAIQPHDHDEHLRRGEIPPRFAHPIRSARPAANETQNSTPCSR